SRRRHTRSKRDWSSDVCSSDLLLGLNPHSGDGGLIGTEEQSIIIPTINKLKEEGLLCFGPYSADGFFARNYQQHFDAVWAMYHEIGRASCRDREGIYICELTMT